MEYGEHLTTGVVVENLRDNNYAQIFVRLVEYLKQISEQLQTLEAETLKDPNLPQYPMICPSGLS